MIKIALADDHTLFREGIRSLINSAKNIDVIGEFENGEDLIKAIPELNPDIVITDISMPGISGIETTKIINEKYPNLPVIILSMHLDEDFVCNSVKAGAKGYLPKDIRKDELLEAINAVYNGENYFSKEVNETIMKSLISRTIEENKVDKEKALTKREIEVVRLVSEGFINKEIADQLNISIRTVDAHKSNVMQKLNIKSNVEIVKYAIKHKLISL